VSVNRGNQRRRPAGDQQPSDATRGNEDRLSALLEALADAVLTLDAAAIIVHANPAAVNLLGAPNDDLRGRGLEDLVRHELPGGLGRSLSSLASGQSNRRMEVDVATGCAFTPAEISVTRLPPAAGPEAFVVILQPISEHRRVEAAMADNGPLLELAHDAILIREFPRDTITFWSPGATQMYGWTAEEAVGRVSDELLHSRFPAPRKAILRELQQTGRWEGELRQRRRSGLEAVIDSRWALLSDHSGAHVIEVDRDVTRRVTVEIALREAEQHLQSVFDHSPIGICTVSPDGRILTANPALERMLQMQLGQAQAHAFRELVHPDDVAPVQDMFQRVVRGDDERVAFERRFRRGDGSFFWGRLTASVVTDGSGTLLFCVAVLEDIDDRRRVDAAMDEVTARLDSLNRAKSALVSGVSHEFRTALTGIQGFSELLRDHDLEPGEAKELAADINSEALRLGRLIDDLLDLDRLESGGIPLRRQPVDLNALLTSLADRMRGHTSGRQVVLRLAPDLPLVEADADRLTQVFGNLFSNAVKYSPPDSPIEVTSEATTGGVRIIVRDWGPGIPAESLESVFDHYTRLEREAGPGVIGTGLGLPIVRQIAAMHGGIAWAQNAAGGGAALTVELPVSAPQEVVDAGPGL
jgi:PAS domain S-box-containing protein